MKLQWNIYTQNLKLSKALLTTVLATVSISLVYFVGSTVFSGNTFYFFDILWRVGIIFILLFFAKFRPLISISQWAVIGLVFSLEYILYTLLSPHIPIHSMLISIVFAPILEEFFFRGWMMGKIDGSDRKKIFLSSVFFGLYHIKNAHILTLPALFYQVLYAGCIVGPLFAFARLRTNTIFTSIILHSGNNAIADIITPNIFPSLIQKRG